MATMKEKTHYNKTHYCKCQKKAIATVYREMSQEKKDIVEEMGFGALANVPEMNVSNTLLKELLDRFDEEKGCLKTLQEKIYITPQKVAVALGITNGGNHFFDKVDYNNLNPVDKECAGYECRRGGEPEKNQEDFCCLYTKVLLAPHNRVENKRKRKKQSVDGCVFVLMLIYFYETKFPLPFAPDAPPALWVAHSTRQMILEQISREATEPLGLLYNKGKKKLKTKTSNLDKKEKGKKIKKKIVEMDSSSEEERFSESESESQNEQAKDNAAKRRKRALEMIREKRSKKRNDGAQSANIAPDHFDSPQAQNEFSQTVPTVNLDSEQLLQTQGSSTPSVNAVSNTRHPLALSLPSSVQEELIRDDFIYVPPQNETQQTSNNDCPPEPEKQGVTVSLTSSIIEKLIKDDYVYEVSNQDHVKEEEEQSKEPPVAQQSKQEAPVDVKREDERASFNLEISPPASQPSKPSQLNVSQLEILKEAVVDAGVTAALNFAEATTSELTLPASEVYKTPEKKKKKS
ncbi:hypothetical protein Ahy_B01g054289 [Arachis hypogaea]|uniref:Uncharacterized protein n=1 Tax=Arachis hypogaea TaxID=3818 RepID=A0A445ATM5_ARAHY|nr:hypothetical protein Ahy_B01g054289 [Arachis hypogaea]